MINDDVDVEMCISIRIKCHNINFPMLSLGTFEKKRKKTTLLASAVRKLNDNVLKANRDKPI